MEYQPLAEVRKTLRVKWYRCAIPHAKLRELSRRSDAQGWFQAGGHLALFLLTGTLAYLLWIQQLWIGLFLALFIHGSVASFFIGVAPPGPYVSWPCGPLRSAGIGVVPIDVKRP